MKKTLFFLNLMLSLSALEVNAWWFESSKERLKQFLINVMRNDANTYLVIDALRDGKIGVNEPVGENGETLLHFATYYKEVFLVESLLNFGANPNQFDKEGKKPFDYLFGSMSDKYKTDYRVKAPGDNQYNRITRALLNAGAVQSHSDLCLSVSLEHAIKAGYPKTAKAIEEHSNKLGYNYPSRFVYPLHFAAKINDKEVARLAIKEGYDLDQRDILHGYTPAGQAFKAGNYSLGAYLGAVNLAQKYLKNKQEQVDQGYASMDLID